jgi:Uncharacterized protein conserved in bacteria
LVWAIKEVAPEKFKFYPQEFDRLAGTPKVRLQLDAGESPKKIISEWVKESKKFEKLRAKYLLYK